MTIKEIEENRDSLIESLIAEEQELIKKIKKSRSNDDYGLYKNLIRALTDVTSLKQREMANIPRDRWINMFSKHKMDIEGEMVDVVSTWRQKGEDIQDHHVYKIEKEITDNPINNLYYDLECRDDNLFKCTIYFKDKIYGVIGDCKYIATYITSLCYDEKVNIYGDIRAFGIALADILKEVGYIVKPTTMIINDVTKNIIGKEIKQDYSKSR